MQECKTPSKPCRIGFKMQTKICLFCSQNICIIVTTKMYTFQFLSLIFRHLQYLHFNYCKQLKRKSIQGNFVLKVSLINQWKLFAESFSRQSYKEMLNGCQSKSIRAVMKIDQMIAKYVHFGMRDFFIYFLNFQSVGRSHVHFFQLFRLFTKI